MNYSRGVMTDIWIFEYEQYELGHKNVQKIILTPSINHDDMQKMGKDQHHYLRTLFVLKKVVTIWNSLEYMYKQPLKEWPI